MRPSPPDCLYMSLYSQDVFTYLTVKYFSGTSTLVASM